MLCRSLLITYGINSHFININIKHAQKYGGVNVV